jgi:hypothetical protein
MRPLSFRRGYFVAAFGAAIVLSTPAAGQAGQGDGFLFKRPIGSFALRVGFDQATASSDIFSFVTDELTLGRSDFAGLSYAANLSFRLRPRLDIELAGAYSGSSAESEFRHFVDNNDLPIEQTTALRRVPLTASAKFYFASRGRSIGRYAWIPTKFVPYVGAGGGAMWYRFEQKGDFIDMETTEVFPDAFESSGWTPTANGFAGVEISLGPRLGFTAEGRYAWARAKLGRDFDGFERIDLSGYNGTLGFFVRF